MFYFKLKISYDGSQFFGWQKQAGKIKTIQGHIEFALQKIAKGNNFQTIGSGRTDAKVHAKEQVVLVRFPFFIEAKSLMAALNSLINNQIFIFDCEKVDSHFHPIRDAKSKEYRYYFCFKRLPFPWLEQYVATFNGGYNINLMKQVCNEFVGEHDFCNFFTVGTPVKSTIRTIYHCELSEVSELKKIEDQQVFPFLPKHEIYEFKVVGSGFMKQMVRLMMGTLLEVGKEKCELSQVRDALLSKLDKSQKLGSVVQANGLYLYKVNY